MVAKKKLAPQTINFKMDKGKLVITVDLDVVYGETSRGNLKLTPPQPWHHVEGEPITFALTVIQQVN